jgi:3-deoxy-D-manno-octulosonic-acid transferase
MYFIYSLVLGLAFLILLPRFLLDAFRHGKYVAGFKERLGFVPPLDTNGRSVIWVHCVSVGETQAARPLVKQLRERFPNHLLAISTTTRTGQEFARVIFQDDAAAVFYFPFDWRWIVRRTLEAIKPKVVLIMETELWPGFLRECSDQGIPAALVNGRLSRGSFSRYQWIRPFMKRVVSCLALAIMQTEEDAERIQLLGMNADRIRVFGNTKFDVGGMPINVHLCEELRERFHLTTDSPVIVAASTHDPEEVIILNSFHQLLSRTPGKPRLLLAPRHPERFAAVAELITASGLRWSRRAAKADASDRQAEVILLDSIGELASLYSLATVVFVGGSIAKIGGHNILEPAAVGTPIIVGPHTANFASIVETFRKAGALIQLEDVSESAMMIELTDVISDLLISPQTRKELATLAYELVDHHRGATARSVDALAAFISAPNSPEAA